MTPNKCLAGIIGANHRGLACRERPAAMHKEQGLRGQAEQTIAAALAANATRLRADGINRAGHGYGRRRPRHRQHAALRAGYSAPPSDPSMPAAASRIPVTSVPRCRTGAGGSDR